MKKKSKKTETVTYYTWKKHGSKKDSISIKNIKPAGKKPPVIDALIGKLTMDMLKNPDTVHAFKQLCVSSKSYELAARVRDLELKYFPKRVSGSKEKLFYEQAADCARMISMKSDARSMYAMHLLLKAFTKKRGKFSIKDAVKIEMQVKELFW